MRRIHNTRNTAWAPALSSMTSTRSIGNTASPRILGARTGSSSGDSHAGMLAEGIAKVRPDLNLLQATETGCVPVLQPKFGEDPYCTALIHYIFHDYIEAHKPDVLMLAANWQPSDLPRLNETMQFLKGRTPKIILVGPVMQYGRSIATSAGRGCSRSQSVDRSSAPHSESRWPGCSDEPTRSKLESRLYLVSEVVVPRGRLSAVEFPGCSAPGGYVTFHDSGSHFCSKPDELGRRVGATVALWAHSSWRGFVAGETLGGAKGSSVRVICKPAEVTSERNRQVYNDMEDQGST